jgi:N-acetylmuramoyl-L-alanine amidase
LEHRAARGDKSSGSAGTGRKPLKRTAKFAISPPSVRFGRKIALPIILGLGAIFWLWPARSARSDNFIFYLPKTRQVVPIQMVDNVRYLPLVKVLGLVGTVTALEEKRGSLKLGVGDNRLELHEGNKKLKVNRHDIHLSTPVRVEGGEWLVPLDFLDSALPQLTAETIQYRAGDERVFIGNVNPLTFSAHLSPLANGDRLSVQFTAPVSVQTASTNGRWVIYLGDKALMPLEAQMRFQSRYISDMRFDDQDGVPKLILTPTEASLNFYPTTADGGKTLQIDVTQGAVPPAQVAAGTSKSPPQTAAGAAPAATATGTSGAATPGATPNGGAAPGAPAAAPAVAPVLPVVVLDAGHGGSDTGARSRDGVTERDLVAALAERVRAALAATGKVHVTLTRTGTADPTLDERDAITNMARPVIFLTLHAGDLGGGSPAIAVYTYQPPSPQASLAARAFFMPWDQAQAAHLMRSRDLANLLAQQFGRVQNLEVRSPLPAPVRQLRSVDAPAVALEIGTLAPRQDAAALTAAAFQDQLAGAIAQAVLALTQGAS